MTREEAIRIGSELQYLMQTKGFQTAIQIMQMEYRDKVFASQPDESNVRETAYLEARALDNLLATFNSFVAIAEQEALVSLAYGDEEEIDHEYI